MPEKRDFVVKTLDFTGPMDLLVYLIRKKELDIAYLSVSDLAADYLNWLESNDVYNIDDAGEFIFLAAILLELKAVSLLPEPESVFEEQVRILREDHSEELWLLRSGINHLSQLEEDHLNLFNRGSFSVVGLDQDIRSEMLEDVTLYDLAVAFRGLILQLPSYPVHSIEKISYSLEGQMAFILSFFQNRKRVDFGRFASSLSDRIAVIVTFLAMLELIRRGRMSVSQRCSFGTMWLSYRSDGFSSR